MTYYELLGVSQTASLAEITKAYRSLALKVHPDHNKDPQATGQFITLHKAYQTLIDPKQRKYYDGLITTSPKAPPRPAQEDYEEYARKQREYVRRAEELLKDYLGGQKPANGKTPAREIWIVAIALILFSCLIAWAAWEGHKEPRPPSSSGVVVGTSTPTRAAPTPTRAVRSTPTPVRIPTIAPILIPTVAPFR